MRTQIVTVNHGTTSFADLLLRSLIAHHRDRTELSVLVLDSESDDLACLEWAREYGVRIEPSGYTRDVPITTHREILRDAVLANPDCDAYLFVDTDVCFVNDNTIPAMANELATDEDLFAVQAQWGHEDGTTFDSSGYAAGKTSRVRESLLMFGQTEWTAPIEYDIGYGDRIHPFCALIRNDSAFRTTVAELGLSLATTQCVHGGLWFDTLGPLTQVMKTHGRTWRTSGQRVLHFGNVSWNLDWAKKKASRRDALLLQY